MLRNVALGMKFDYNIVVIEANVIQYMEKGPHIKTTIIHELNLGSRKMLVYHVCHFRFIAYARNL